MSSASTQTLTLPGIVPANGWYIDVQNTGVGALLLSLNGHTLDGAATGPDIDQNAGMRIFSNGTNYFTQRGMGQEFYNNTAVFQANTRIVTGRATFAVSNTVVVALSGEAAFTSTSSFNCSVTETAGNTGNRMSVTYTSGTSITITSQASTSETVSYICIGN